MKVLLIVGLSLVTLILLLGLGLQVRPRPFPATAAASGPVGPVGTVALPDELPPPVSRFYRVVYGDASETLLPPIASAVVSGRARMRIGPVTLPGRFRFSHEPGRAYRHEIEATWFGLRLLTVDERYVDGAARLQLPFGVTEGEPKVDAAANLGLWAEAIWFPAAFVTDPRAAWQPVDEHTAVLSVPFGEARQRLVARFDPDTGLLRLMEAMRFKNADDPAPTLWIAEVREWRSIGGRLLPGTTALTWFDEGSPWAVFDVDEVAYDVDVADALRGGGD